MALSYIQEQLYMLDIKLLCTVRGIVWNLVGAFRDKTASFVSKFVRELPSNIIIIMK